MAQLTPRELRHLSIALQLALNAERAITEAELVELMLSFGANFRDSVNEETIHTFLHTPIADLLVKE